jgi:hypothetical protein
MYQMLRHFFRSLIRPGDYLNSDNIEKDEGIDEGVILNNVDISVKAALLALVIIALPKSGGSPPPRGPKIPPNYEFLAKLYKRVGEEIYKKNQNSISSDKKSSRIVSRRKIGDKLVIGLGPPITRPPLKESQIALPKEHIQKLSLALVPYQKNPE